MKIVGDPSRKLRSHTTKSRSAIGHYRESDLGREFGGTFITESRGRVVVLGEVDGDEPNLRPFRKPFVTAEDVAAPNHDLFSGLLPTADTLTGALELDAKVVTTIGNNFSFLAIAFHMAKKERLFDLFNVLPIITQYAVTKFGAETVISALESQQAQDDVDSLFSLVRAARVELAEQEKGLANRAVACGILQALGFTVEEIGKLKATKKIRPANLAAA